MLNKSAERVLKCAIKKSANNLNKKIELSDKNFKNSKFTISYINAICEELSRKRYIKHLQLDYDCKYSPTFYLTHEGFSYFEIKKTQTKTLWLKNAWMPILVTIGTNLLVIGIKALWPLILELFANSR